MAKRAFKPCPRCSTTDKLEAELVRIADELSALILEKGPRCRHPVGSADIRNVRLMEERAAIAVRLQEANERADDAEQELSRIAQAERKKRSRRG